ncbi:PadR family transcriptional regulator, regulatory protein PadR [Porphyromonas sp. 31_2]|nr:PadR family transcriptional regulator, regulatory protein PadR [Porphyromonas sp. 31_2]
MNAENVKSQMRKGTLEYCILLLLKKNPLTPLISFRSYKKRN